MKVLIIFLAAQVSAVIFTQNHQEVWTTPSYLSLAGLVFFSGLLITNLINYKN